jgi:hypothetical protein
LRLERLEGQVSAADQVGAIEGLSDIEDNLGLISAGEIRFGTGAPGKPSFTGLRIRGGDTQMYYGSTDYLMAGVDADTMQWGVRSCDGSLDYPVVSTDIWHDVGDSDDVYAVAYENSWVAYDAGTWGYGRFAREGNVVYLEGLVKSGTVGQDTGVIFTLPDTDWAPSIPIIQVVATNTGDGRLDVLTDGRVVANTGGNTWYSIKCTYNTGFDG